LAGLLLFSTYNLSFLLQRHNVIEANAQRNRIQSSAAPQINAAEQEKDLMIVLASVPTYTQANFNNETIFSDEVLDWGNYLRVQTDVKTILGISLSPGRLLRKEIAITDGKVQVYTLPKPLDADYFWYYDVRTGKLEHIHSIGRMQEILEETETDYPYVYPAPVDARLRDELRNWLASY
jgi:hypothetical protein